MPGDGRSPIESIASTATDDTVCFIGRVVAEASRRPLVRARVAVSDPKRPEGDDELAHAESASDGTFRVCTPRVDHVRLAIEVTGRVRTGGGWSGLRAGVVDLGDIEMASAVRVSLRVVDEVGHPVQGVWIHVGPRQADVERTAWRTGPIAVHRAAVETDDDGRVAAVHLAPGRYDISMLSSPYGARAGWAIDVPNDRAQMEHALKLHRPDPQRCVAGHVLDDHGAPLADVDVYARIDQNWSYRVARTDARGFFCQQARHDKLDIEFVRVGAGNGDEGYEWDPVGPTRFAAGTTNAVVCVQARPTAAPGEVRALDVPLEVALPWTVRAVDADGHGVTSARVELLRLVGHHDTPTWHNATPAHLVFDKGVYSALLTVGMADVTADHTGKATLHSESNLGQAAVRVTGFATVGFGLPPMPELRGASLFVQAVVVDPQAALGLAFSAGRHLELGD